MPHELTIEDLHIQEPEREDETLEWLLRYIDEMCYRFQTLEWEGVTSAIPPIRPYIAVTTGAGQRWGIPDLTGRGLTIVGALQDGLRHLCEPKPVTIPRYELATGHALDLLAAQRNVHRTVDVDDETLRRVVKTRRPDMQPMGLLMVDDSGYAASVYGDLSAFEVDGEPVQWTVAPYFSKHIPDDHHVNAEVETRGCDVALTGTVEPGREDTRARLDAALRGIGEQIQNAGFGFAMPHDTVFGVDREVNRILGLHSIPPEDAEVPSAGVAPILPPLPDFEDPKLFETDPVYVGKRNLARALTEAQCRAGGHPSGHPENERQVEHAMEWLEGQVRIWVQWLGGARTEADR